MVFTDFVGYVRLNKYTLKHRSVMEIHLGRSLTKEEVVHHIDFNKLNNEIDNLHLFSSRGEHIKYHGFLRGIVYELIGHKFFNRKEHNKQYRQENKKKVNELSKQYYKKNKEKLIKYDKQYRHINKEKIRERGKKYYQKNKELINEYSRQYYQQNKEKLREQNRKYCQINKEMIKERHKKYYQKNKK